MKTAHRTLLTDNWARPVVAAGVVDPAAQLKLLLGCSEGNERTTEGNVKIMGSLLGDTSAAESINP